MQCHAKEAHISHENHASCRYQVEESFDIPMLFKEAAYMLAGGLVLNTHVVSQDSDRAQRPSPVQEEAKHSSTGDSLTRLDVTDEECSAGSFPLDALLND